MVMLAPNDSTSNLGNTISDVIQNAAPLMSKKKKKKKISSAYRTVNLLVLNLRLKKSKRNKVESFLVSCPLGCDSWLR